MRTADSTAEIDGLLGSLASRTGKAAGQMYASLEVSQQSVRSIGQVCDSFGHSREAVDVIGYMHTQITTAPEGQHKWSKASTAISAKSTAIPKLLQS